VPFFAALRGLHRHVVGRGGAGVPRIGPLRPDGNTVPGGTLEPKRALGSESEGFEAAGRLITFRRGYSRLTREPTYAQRTV
jgi:hypothetical protein